MGVRWWIHSRHDLVALRVMIQLIAAALSPVMVGTSAASGSTVRALALPRGFTIAPEAEHRLMSIGLDGTVYAVAHRIDRPDGGTRAVRWRAQNAPELFVPVPGPNDFIHNAPAPSIEAVVPASDMPYVTVARTFDGAFSGARFSIDRWSVAAVTWSVPACANLGYAGAHISAADGRQFAFTVDPSSSSANPAGDENLPRAIILTDGSCRSLGTGILTGLRGSIAVGYLGYIDGKPTPVIVNTIHQRMLAFRWTKGYAVGIGDGVPYATTSRGIVVGASALPGRAREFESSNFSGQSGTYSFAIPHAVIWSRENKETAIFRDDVRSVAWDINELGTTVGMVQSADGKHHAFRRDHGRTTLLDDLPHPTGWRFESAYAITGDGWVVGIGTYRGVPTAFLWRL
jgi:hypothetical protein